MIPVPEFSPLVSRQVPRAPQAHKGRQVLQVKMEKAHRVERYYRSLRWFSLSSQSAWQ
jgi:hypothetical protein